MTLIVVEHADTGETTLHRADCPHWKRAQYHHPVDDMCACVIDRMCRTCNPKPEREGSPP